MPVKALLLTGKLDVCVRYTLEATGSDGQTTQVIREVINVDPIIIITVVRRADVRQPKPSEVGVVQQLKHFQVISLDEDVFRY